VGVPCFRGPPRSVRCLRQRGPRKHATLGYFTFPLAGSYLVGHEREASAAQGRALTPERPGDAQAGDPLEAGPAHQTGRATGREERRGRDGGAADGPVPPQEAQRGVVPRREEPSQRLGVAEHVDHQSGAVGAVAAEGGVGLRAIDGHRPGGAAALASGAVVFQQRSGPCRDFPSGRILREPMRLAAQQASDGVFQARKTP